MRIHDVLNESLMAIGALQRAAKSAGREEELSAWHHLLESMLFTIRTGQVYRFEDYLKGLNPGRTASASAALGSFDDAASRQAIPLLLQTLNEVTEARRKRQLLVVIDLLDFLATTGQHDAFAEYLKTYYVEPPPVLACFDTHADAEVWLNGLSEPPSWASVLIGDEYHEVWYSREEGTRRLLRDHVTELFLEDYGSKPQPPVAASFDTREEALAWLKGHPASPMTLVSIAGEPYHAVYQKNCNRHSLHSLSRLRESRRASTPASG